MATTKKRSEAGKGRPRLRSSHEEVLGAPVPKKRPKAKSPAAPEARPARARAGGATKGAERRPGRAAPAEPRSVRRPPSPRADEAKPSIGLPRPRPRKAKTGTPATPKAASEASREVATAIAVAAIDKKAVGLQILDVAGKVDYADFLVVMTGRSDRHVQSLAQAIEDDLQKKGHRALAVEGLPHASWVLMDYGDVVVHVFQDEARSLYDIEGLWMDARRIPLPPGVE